MRFILIILILIYNNKVFSQSWQNVGAGLSENVYDLTKFQDRLYACGNVEVGYWNDTSWTLLPPVFGIAYPLSIEVYNDTLFVAGDFPFSGSISNVYKFDGENWNFKY
jgi:hypothetical protein